MSWLSYLFPPLRHKTHAMIELASDAPTIRHTPPLTTKAEPVAVVIEPMHPLLYSVDALGADELERHLIAVGNARLQGVAQRVAAAKSRLCDLTAAAESLSMAVDAAHYTGCDTEAWLQNQLTEVQAQIAQAEAGRKRMEVRRIARSNCTTPLKSAVSQRHSLLVRERDVLSDRLHLLRRGHGIDLAPSQLLRQAGLTSEQIAAVGTINPGEADIANYTDRLAAAAPEIASIEAWIASGHQDHTLLSGLGFDTQIAAAQPVGEKEAP